MRNKIICEANQRVRLTEEAFQAGLDVIYQRDNRD